MGNFSKGIGDRPRGGRRKRSSAWPVSGPRLPGALGRPDTPSAHGRVGPDHHRGRSGPETAAKQLDSLGPGRVDAHGVAAHPGVERFSTPRIVPSQCGIKNFLAFRSETRWIGEACRRAAWVSGICKP